MKEQSQYKNEASEDVMFAEDHLSHLIMWNDDFNSFDWVIQTLMEVCNHSQEQAEQCSLLIHTKGKYAVKEGCFEKLQPLRVGITDRGISATIEQLA